MTETHEGYHIDVGHDLEITHVQPHTGFGGAWVKGRLNGHRFEALVFPQKAQRPEWEYKASRISKLWLQRLADRKIVFHWDRAPDVPAADALAQAIVEFLTAGLADHLYTR